ncbi:unnamed protein product [Urochloa decumbens]|uniref:Uncharacterized protein n=1 Tax=Urochloa decumbens TaxID=240449 RepID=A0ABC9DXZ9_9POAL
MDGIQLENPPSPAVPVARNDGERHGPSLLTMLGFAFLSFNSVMAVYRSNGDTGAITFVAFSYLDLVLLFYSRKIHDGAGDPPNSHRRRVVRASVWVLTTLLTVMFFYKVAAVMPLPLAAVVWAMTAAGMLGIFYGFCAPPATASQRQIEV